MKNNLKITVDIDALSLNISKLPSDIKKAELNDSEKLAIKEDLEDIISKLEKLKEKAITKK